MKQRALALTALVALVAALALAGGCAATYTAVKYQDLEVQTNTSDSIFLDPVGPDKRTIFIQVRNSSDKNFFIQDEVKAALSSKGYRVVDNPDLAHYYLQANVLTVGMVSKTAAEESRMAGFGGPLVGAAVGALVAGGPAKTGGAIIGGLVGATAELISGGATKVINYTVITDVQVSERTNQVVSERTKSTMSQGTSGQISQQSAGVSDRKQYRTRVVSTARKVNLKFEEAYPALRQGLVQAMAGLF